MDLTYLIKKNLPEYGQYFSFSSSIKKEKFDVPINRFFEIINKYKYFSKKLYIIKKRSFLKR